MEICPIMSTSKAYSLMTKFLSDIFIFSRFLTAVSVVEYLKPWHQCNKEINWQSEGERLILIWKRFLPDGSEGEIIDVNSLLAKLEERSLLGIDRPHVLRGLLKGMRKWDLLRMLDELI